MILEFSIGDRSVRVRNAAYRRVPARGRAQRYLGEIHWLLSLYPGPRYCGGAFFEKRPDPLRGSPLFG